MSILKKQGKSITSFDYNNKEIADYIYSAINSTQFLGISVSFFVLNGRLEEKIINNNEKPNFLGLCSF